MRSTRTWIAALGLLVAVATVGITMAHVLSGDAEIRISAQRLEDGRTEFAVQQRVDGEWGERILPRVRFLPASPTPGWKNSSPVTVQTEAGDDAGDQGASAEALEAAQREAETAKQELMEAKARLAVLEAPIHRELGLEILAEGRILTEVIQQGSNLQSTLTIQADGEYGLTDIPLTLVVECSDGSRFIRVEGIQIDPVENERGQQHFSVTYRLSTTPSVGLATVRGDTWWGQPNWNGPGQLGYPQFTRVAFYLGIREADSLEVAITGANDEFVEATFNLEGAWDTPIQPNLDRCDDYH